MYLEYSDDFKKEYRKIKDNLTRVKITKQLQKILETPEAGKPLMHNLKNHRSLRVHPFRIIYRIEKDKLLVLCFDHRKEVYE